MTGLRIRRVPQPQKEAVKKLIDELKGKDIILPSKSPWASLVVLIPKKDRGAMVKVSSLCRH